MERYSQLRRYCQLGATTIAIALVSLLSSTSVQAADNSLPVTVHQHVNFNGQSLSVGEGEVTIQELRSSVGNDRISSISIEPGYSVLACKNSRLRGRCELFSSDTSDLRTISFNDVVSSLLISKSADSSPVAVYKDVNFNGRFLGLDEGDVTIQELRDSVGNDRISSITIEPGYSVLACQHSGLRGRCEIFTSDTPDLRTISFNDVISSLRITKLADQPPVTVFQNVNFNGNSLAIEQEGVITIQDLRNSSVGNDVISSIQISEGYQVEACEHSREGGSGRCETFTSSISDLRTISFNDTVSFLRVTLISDTPPVNTAPTATNILLDTRADTPVQFTTAQLLAASNDVDGDTLVLDVTPVPGLSQISSTLTYTPPVAQFANLLVGETEEVRITYRVRDDEGETSNPAFIIITVNGVVEPELPTDFSVSVRVTSPVGGVITDVTVSDALTGDEFGVTDADGNVVFNIPDAAGSMNLRLTADGYASQITPLSIIDGAESAVLEITMIESVDANSELADLGWEVNIGNSSVVSWAVDSFVTAEGVVVADDQISLIYTTVDVSNQAELEAFPGSFTGTVGDSLPTNIASLGTSEYVFVNSQDGSELQLGDRASALISLPLYIGTHPSTGDPIVINSTLPIWSLNELTGVWIQETDGTVVASNSSPTGMAVEATVTHFSWWNIGVPIETSDVIIETVGIGLDGTVSVTATPSDDLAFRPANGIKPINGSFTTAIPTTSDYCFSGIAQLSDGQTVSTDTVCSGDLAGADSTTITLTIGEVDAEFAITADVQPDDFGNFSVNGSAGVPTQRVRIRASSFESNVTYTANGLPAGINLVRTSDVAAELVGIPTSDGSFNATVFGVNANGDMSNSISVDYTVVVGAGAPGTPVMRGELLAVVNCELGDSDFINGGFLFFSPLFTSVPFNNGFYEIFFGTVFQGAISYELFDPDTFPLPSGLSFNAELGRFETGSIFSVMDWMGPILIETNTDATSGLYSVSFINDPFNCR